MWQVGEPAGRPAEQAIFLDNRVYRASRIYHDKIAHYGKMSNWKVEPIRLM